jgi:hypothetical protein
MSDNDEHDDEQIVMIRRAIFGKQVESFMNSEIGRYLVNRAIEEKAEAQGLFLTADCAKIEYVRSIQNKILMADNFVNWLKDAVGDGIQALNIIEDRT